MGVFCACRLSRYVISKRRHPVGAASEVRRKPAATPTAAMALKKSRRCIRNALRSRMLIGNRPETARADALSNRGIGKDTHGGPAIDRDDTAVLLRTAAEMGWSALSNGLILDAAEAAGFH